MELSGCAAACYTAAGWRRTGELVSRLAEILAQRGQLAASVAALQRQARLFLSEGWLHQAARLLHELLDCQHLLPQVASPGSSSTMVLSHHRSPNTSWCCSACVPSAAASAGC